MPASLAEAFSAPSASNTESLHNPEYRRYGQDYGMGGGLEQHGGHGGHTMFGAGPSSLEAYQQQGGGSCDPYPRLGNLEIPYQDQKQNQNQSQIQSHYQHQNTMAPTISTATLDGETKCDLHIYHILSCPECRERIKKLLADPTAQASEPETKNSSLGDSLISMFGGGERARGGEGALERFLGLQISEKLDQLLSRKKAQTLAEDDQTADQVGFLSRGFEGLLVYILLGVFLIFVLDMLTRMGKTLA